MRASDDEQGINKLRPNIGRLSFQTRGTNRLGIISQKFREFSFAAVFKVEYFDISYGSSYEFHEIYFKQKNKSPMIILIRLLLRLVLQENN